MVQYRFDLLDDALGRQQCALTIGTASEREQLSNSFCAAFRAGLQRAQEMLPVLFRPRLFQELDRHQDGSQQIVEIMRDPSSQDTDALQSLAAQQLCFQLLPPLHFLTQGSMRLLQLQSPSDG